jgi:pimeloyl-ACP methyl ester carboxylesterase
LISEARARKPVFVLIHSPLLGPTTWAPVARELKVRGRQAIVPSLLGLAQAPSPQWQHVPESVRAATANVSDPIVLVGHSGAGPLLPAIAVALEGGIASLIFADAFLPPVMGSAPLAPPEFMDRLRALADEGMLPPWSSWFGEDTMRELVPDDAPRAAVERELPRLPLSYFEASVPVPDEWRRQRCAYLLFSPEPYGPSAAEARDRGCPVAEIAGVGHLAMLTHAISVTEALLDLEREAARQA